MPKKAKHLMEKVLLFSNMQEAFLRAAKGKQGERKVVDFRQHLDENLLQMSSDLRSGKFRFGNYHFFSVYDPKKRTICAASFPERVAFHAIMRVCHQYFENHQIFDSYASRIGKGTYKALERAQQFARRYKWFAKLDVTKYFDSIHHDILYSQLCRMFGDRFVLNCFRQIIESYSVAEKRGLPIGNLTSQYFANHYLTVADRFLKETLKMPAIIRYMDDTLVFANDKELLLSSVGKYRLFLNSELKLQIHTPIINNTCYGVSFLGYVVYDKALRLNQRSRSRFRARMSQLKYSLEHSLIPEQDYHLYRQCLEAFIYKADVAHFTRSLIGKCL